MDAVPSHDSISSMVLSCSFDSTSCCCMGPRLMTGHARAQYTNGRGRRRAGGDEGQLLVKSVGTVPSANRNVSMNAEFSDDSNGQEAVHKSAGTTTRLCGAPCHRWGCRCRTQCRYMPAWDWLSALSESTAAGNR